MYEVEFTSEAEADLDRLSKSVAQRILKKIRWLAENFEVITPEPLTGNWKRVVQTARRELSSPLYLQSD